MKSAGINLMVVGIGDVIDMQFLTRLSDKSWPTFNPAVQQAIESTLASGNNNNDLDLCLILDNSQIVGEQNFGLVKSAMENFTNALSMCTVKITLHLESNTMLRNWSLSLYLSIRIFPVPLTIFAASLPTFFRNLYYILDQTCHFHPYLLLGRTFKISGSCDRNRPYLYICMSVY